MAVGVTASLVPPLLSLTPLGARFSITSRVSVADLAAADGAFIFCYSLGMLVGPVALGETMGRLPLTGFPLVPGAVFAFYVAFAIGSIAASRRHGA